MSRYAVGVRDLVAELRAARWRRAWQVLALLLVLLAVGLELERRHVPAGFRRACDAEGGVVVRLESGPACLWAGAFIPVGVER